MVDLVQQPGRTKAQADGTVRTLGVVEPESRHSGELSLDVELVCDSVGISWSPIPPVAIGLGFVMSWAPVGKNLVPAGASPGRRLIRIADVEIDDRPLGRLGPSGRACLPPSGEAPVREHSDQVVRA